MAWYEALDSAGVTACEEAAEHVCEEAEETETRFVAGFKPYNDEWAYMNAVIPSSGEETVTLTLDLRRSNRMFSLAIGSTLEG